MLPHDSIIHSVGHIEPLQHSTYMYVLPDLSKCKRLCRVQVGSLSAMSARDALSDQLRKQVLKTPRWLINNYDNSTLCLFGVNSLMGIGSPVKERDGERERERERDYKTKQKVGISHCSPELTCNFHMWFQPCSP